MRSSTCSTPSSIPASRSEHVPHEHRRRRNHHRGAPVPSGTATAGGQSDRLRHLLAGGRDRRLLRDLRAARASAQPELLAAAVPVRRAVPGQGVPARLRQPGARPAQPADGRRALLDARPALVALMAMGAGTLISVVAAWWGGWVDSILDTVMDILFAFPGILLAVLTAAVFGAGLIA